MSELSIRSVRKSYGSVEVLHGVDLEVGKGEFIVFVGPSGCGKSTLLRMIAGLESISSGTISVEGTVVNNIEPSKRGIAMVFQNYALYPHMTVAENMGFGLKVSGTPKDQRERRVREAAEMLRLTEYLDRRPRQLSGGQRQRVAIGRAIVRDPKIFLFDEPLSNLDAALRVATRIEISRLKDNLPDTTMVYVTHDQVEAMTLADRIVVLNEGRIEQVGTPLELYDSPNNLFVAQFIGSPSMNVVPADRVAAHLPGKNRENVKIGVRAEHLHVAREGETPLFSGDITLIEELGELSLVYVDTGMAEPVVAKLDRNDTLRRGDRIALSAEHIHYFDASTGSALPIGAS